MSIQLFSVIRDEGPFLLEWLTYHHALGFDRFVLFDDGSRDGSEALIAALQNHLEIDLTDIDVPTGRAPQSYAADLLRTGPHWRPGAWMLWLDPDEFWVPGTGPSVSDWCASVSERLGREVEGIALHWRIFGDAGHTTWPGWHLGTGFDRASLRRFWPG